VPLTFTGCCILTDIEGTTSSISYVYDELFPYVRKNVEAYLQKNWGREELVAAADLIARDAGAPSLAAWCLGLTQPQAIEKLRVEVNRLMNIDSKSTGLKQLQGLVSKAGYDSGTLRAHVYPDVPPALKAWCEKGVDVRIYSSGSIQAQCQFFGHTIAGDLLPFFKGHYDTRVGAKREISSYRNIAASVGRPAGEILFLSDVTAELDAARGAGMQTALLVRPGNPKQPEHTHPVLKTFADLSIVC